MKLLKDVIFSNQHIIYKQLFIHIIIKLHSPFGSFTFRFFTFGTLFGGTCISMYTTEQSIQSYLPHALGCTRHVSIVLHDCKIVNIKLYIHLRKTLTKFTTISFHYKLTSIILPLILLLNWFSYFILFFHCFHYIIKA